MNRLLIRGLPALTLVLIGGCSTAPMSSGPQVQRPSPSVAPPAGMQAAPARNPQAMPPAALALAEAADRAARTHDWPQASRQLERALNIAPRNPLLWQRLAAVRYSQGEYHQAQTFALKSNAYAGSDKALRRLNWRIIAAARRALGDVQGAAEAESRAKAL